MDSEFPFVKVDPKDYSILGKPDSGKRIYRREGKREEMAAWFDRVRDVAGHVFSPGGCGIYAHVSRAGIYKAINEGRLTAFAFHVTGYTRSVFGFKRKMRESAYVFIPVEECKAWGEIIDAKAKAKALTAEDDPGWVPDRTYYKWERGPLERKYPKKRRRKKA